ncbi:hypothetical protein EV182_000006 [Spiromyces aspiralis]|uniref:Uncharacterized protein n=1 Tax=Spiromyces aspiralis TaxID=68401 RepID=A0ACC1HYJ8_9FUNG|nr:hypothetical protein EV182_000006 [Spiromyces aspiralis]
MGKTSKNKRQSNVGLESEVEVDPSHLAPIAQPLADKRLSKKLLKTVKKATKQKHIKRGVKEVVKGLRKGDKGLVVLAGNTSPIDVISHIPVLCEDNKVPYCFVASRDELGKASSTKRPTSCIMIVPGGKTGKESQDEYKENYSECHEVIQDLNNKAALSGFAVQAFRRLLSDTPGGPVQQPLFPFGSQRPPRIRYFRPIAWSLAFCGTAFVCAAYASKESKEKQVSDQKRRLWQGLLDLPEDLRARAEQVLRGYGPNDELERTRRRDERKKAIQRIMAWPSWVPDEAKKVCIIAVDKWYSVPASQRLVYCIVGANLLVFGLWQVPRAVPFMSRHFLHDPRSGKSYTLFTSMFSHNELLHLGFNMVALLSFSKAVGPLMGAEQFTAFYLSSGVLASLTSHLGAGVLRSTILPSLGASGAIYALLGATMMYYPHSKVSLIFLPFFPISIGHAFPALMLFDVMGILLRWQQFDHVVSCQ